MLLPTSGRNAPTAKGAAGDGWAGGPAVFAGGGRGLAPALREPLRVIAHIDMDAFYAQIEQLRDTALTGRPVVVVQYPTSNHDIKDMAPDDNRVVDGSASSIIAVSYEARPFGVKRGMKAADARKLCPELVLVQVPTRHGKADISLYRYAGEKVVDVLERAGGALTVVEKASIDEVYVDVTRAAHALLASLRCGGSEDGDHQQQPQQGKGGNAEESGEAVPEATPEEGGKNECKRWEEIGDGGWKAVVTEGATTRVAGLSDDGATKEKQLADGVSWWGRPEGAFVQEEKLLSCGAAVVSRLRAAVRSELSYSCTAGVSHNKLLAKLCSNMHKPNAQTVLPLNNVESVFHTLPVERVKGWGGKLGVKIMEKLGVSTAGEVAAVGVAELQRALGDEEGWRAWEKSNAVCRDPVKPRSAPKSVGCSKTFPGKAKLTTISEIERWLSELSKELVLRLGEQWESEEQTPSKLTVSFAEIQQKGRPKAVSRCCRMVKPEVQPVVEACMKMVRAYKTEVPQLSMLGVSAHGFAAPRKDTPSIQSFFGTATSVAPGSELGGPQEGRRRQGERTARTSPTGSAILGFPKATAMVVVENAREVGVKRRWMEDGTEDVGVRLDGVLSAGQGVDSGDGVDDSGSFLTSTQGRVSMCSGADAAAEEGRRRETVDGKGGGAEGDTPVLREERPHQREMENHIEKMEKEEHAGEDLDVVQFCGVVRGNGKPDLQPCESVQGERGGARQEADVAHAATAAWKAGGPVGAQENEWTGSGRVGLEDKVGSAAEGAGEQRPMFGRGGSSGVFGEVDSEVLAELPLEIQREIWMQQGRQAAAGSGQQLQLRFSREGKTWGGSSAGTGGGRASGAGTQQQQRGRGGGRGGRRGKGGAPKSRGGSGSISSFFGQK